MDITPAGPSADFEVLLGVMAVTTFLVGFSTVRMQASLQEWRERGERIVNRLLEQNAGEDLLPLPTTLRTLSGATQKLKIDVVTWLTLIATVVSFLTFVLLSSELASSAPGFEGRFLNWLNGLLSLIAFIAVVDVLVVKLKAWKELRHTPTRIYSQLNRGLLKWSRHPNKDSYWRSGYVLRKCQEFEQMIPDWCWISLIRYDVQKYYSAWSTQLDSTSGARRNKVPFSMTGSDVVVLPLWLVRIATLQFRKPVDQMSKGFDLKLFLPAVRRLRGTAGKFKSSDDHSLVAYVWASFLLDDAAAVSEQDLAEVNNFRLLTDDTFAELALRCAARTLATQADVNDSRLATIANIELPSHIELTWRQQLVTRILSALRIADINE